MGGGLNVEQKNLCNGLSMFTLFSVEWGNSASFTSELAGFLCVICM